MKLSPAQDAALACPALMDVAEQGGAAATWRIGAHSTTLTSLCKAGYLIPLDYNDKPVDRGMERWACAYALTGKGRAIVLGKTIAMYERRIEKLLALKASIREAA